jgi:hypothetical protein
MNLLKKYKEQIEAAIVLGAFPVLIIGAQVLNLCNHC